MCVAKQQFYSLYCVLSLPSKKKSNQWTMLTGNTGENTD